MGNTLVVDAGNSSLKWALAHGLELDGQARRPYREATLSEILDSGWSELAKPERVMVASVAGDAAQETLRSWVAARWDEDAEFVVPGHASHGVINAYMSPERLGADRWAALIAAYRRFGGPCCIVDCGTAVTIDAVSASGEHLGGLILPGITMMRRALVENTQQIGPVSRGQVSLLARNTEDAVTAGTLYTVVAAVDRIVADVAAELGGPVVRVATGGDAQMLLPLLTEGWRHEPDLVLHGLAFLAEERDPQ